jgi:hypothetical protein
MMMRQSLTLLAIYAMQEPQDRRTAEAWVRFCIRAAEEAHAAVIENPPEAKIGSVGKFMLADSLRRGIPVPTERLDGDKLDAVAREAAKVAFRACMPLVTGRRNTQAYIACVAAGVQLKYIEAVEARSLLYTAQLALTAARSSRAK